MLVSEMVGRGSVVDVVVVEVDVVEVVVLLVVVVVVVVLDVVVGIVAPAQISCTHSALLPHSSVAVHVR